MSKSKTLYESESKEERAAVAAFLRELADQIETGAIALGKGKRARGATLPGRLELEVTLERTTKDKKKRRAYELEIELTWREPAAKPAKKSAAKPAAEAEPEPELPLARDEKEEELAGLLAPVDEAMLLENPEKLLLEAPDEEE